MGNDTLPQLGQPEGTVDIAGRQALRCAFVHSPDPFYANTQNYGAQFMPVWAYTLAAHIPDDGSYVLSLHDTRFDKVGEIPAADVYLFSGVNQDYGKLIETRRDLCQRYPHARSIIGGPICWSFEQAGDLDKLSEFDHIFIGDGEQSLPRMLQDLRLGRPLEPVIRAAHRFDLAEARPLHRPLLEAGLQRYYGAVLEVSRGCPFLCEFCDVRILPDNNRSHNKAPELIVAEMDHLCRSGVREVLFACDNFIGEPRWAEAVVDALITWQRQSGFRPSLYTWLTINIYRNDSLLRKMRQAGFDLLFVGVESFSENSLLETAKVQNTAPEMVAAVRTIQSYGFIVVAGLIFGFDSDDENCFDITLNGLREAGLLSGDPTLLTALPGTPLFRRMKLSGRLREVRYGLGGFKYRTNIKYLMPQEKMVAGYRHFARRYNDGHYQYERLCSFLELVSHGGRFVASESGGYGNLGKMLRLIFASRAATFQLLQRAWRFAARPANLIYALRGLLLLRRYPDIKGRLRFYQFWLFAWSNFILKYQNLSDSDFDPESVDSDFDIRDLVPPNYAETADEAIPRNKIEAQIKTTEKQLARLVADAEETPTTYS